MNLGLARLNSTDGYGNIPFWQLEYLNTIMHCQVGISPLRRALDRQTGLRCEIAKAGMNSYSFV